MAMTVLHVIKIRAIEVVNAGDGEVQVLYTTVHHYTYTL